MFTFTFNGRRDAFDEYVILCYRDGKRYSQGDYFTSDLTDAKCTLNMLRAAKRPFDCDSTKEIEP